MEWYLKVLKNYADFNGRARRKEYWMFTLFNFLICLVLEIAGIGLMKGGIGAIFLIAMGLYTLGILIPSLAVSVRRLHDTDRSGWWLLIALVPLVGGLILLVFMILEGTQGPNQYGSDPKLA